MLTRVVTEGVLERDLKCLTLRCKQERISPGWGPDHVPSVLPDSYGKGNEFSEVTED